MKNTRAETQIWPHLSPAFKPLRAVSAQRAKPKLLLTFKALSDSTSIYLPCQLSSYLYVPATPNPSWHPALPCAPLPTCLMPLWPAFVMHPDDQFQEWALPSTSFMKPMWLNLPRGNLRTVLIPTKLCLDLQVNFVLLTLRLLLTCNYFLKPTWSLISYPVNFSPWPVFYSGGSIDSFLNIWVYGHLHQCINKWTY